MITEKIDREIEFEISYDILDAAIHRCLSNTVRGFVDFERQEPTRATVVYILSQFEFGIFAKIRIDKLKSETTNMSIFELRESFTPKQKQKFFEGEESLKNKMTQLLVEGLKNNESFIEQRKKHFDNVIQKLLNQLDQENISKQKFLTQQFEKWQKQYYNDVYSVFTSGDEQNLVNAFKHWEGKFLRFLKESFPELAKTYEIQTTSSMPLSFYGGNLENFRSVKSKSVEEFLNQCIKSAKNGDINHDYIPPDININITGNVSHTNIVVGNNNILKSNTNKMRKKRP